MEEFKMYETDTFTVFLYARMPSEIREHVRFEIYSQDGSSSFQTLDGNNIKVEPQLGDAGYYTTFVKIEDSADSEIGDISMET